MVQDLGYLKESASQTAGPYVHIGLTPNFADIKGVYPVDLGTAMVNDKTRGERITLTGRVIDGSGTPLKDALIEIWQADANGVYPSAADIQGKAVDPNFHGWGRTGADFETGFWSFNTIKPGAVPGRKGTTQAPHIALIIFARGINIGLNTRVYFEDEAEANAQDPVLKGIEWAPRRQTLIAKREERDGEVVYRFDIRIQGEDETVFLDI